MQIVSEKIRFGIVGSGNVATQIIAAFHKKGFRPEFLCSISGKGKSLASRFDIPYFTQLNDIPPVEVCILCVKDDALTEDLARSFTDATLVCHTAGSVDISVLGRHKKAGVFYPLQTLSSNKNADFQKIPICIEATDDSDLSLLRRLAEIISNDIRMLDSQQRVKAHLAAVFVSNFVNHLYSVGFQLLKESNLEFDLLKPLIIETAEKMNTMLPDEAQTGPAIRGDFKVISKHLKLLETKPEFYNLYQIFTQSIENERRKRS